MSDLAATPETVLGDWAQAAACRGADPDIFHPIDGDYLLARSYCDRWIIEAKATKGIDMAGGMNELAKEKLNAGVGFGVLIVKRRNHGTGRAYVVMELDDFAALMAPEWL